MDTDVLTPGLSSSRTSSSGDVLGARCRTWLPKGERSELLARSIEAMAGRQVTFASRAGTETEQSTPLLNCRRPHSERSLTRPGLPQLQLCRT